MNPLPMIRLLVVLIAAATLAAVAAAEPFDPQPFQPTDLATQALDVKVEAYRIWSDFAPGEKENRPDGEQPQNDGFARIQDVTCPTISVYRPKADTPKSDCCMIIFPGGGYQILAYDHEGIKIADYLAERGITCVVLKYRVPRRYPEPNKKHVAAWQDVQRAVRVVRSHAGEWGFDPEKIGVIGFSAGGHLTLMAATTSQTPSYEPVDELDKTVGCHVNFAVPVYPAYILEDGSNGPNSGKGNDSALVQDFAFDTKTPPMCLIHGDSDGYSPMGSVTIYHKLRTMKVPAEIHVYAKVGHGFGAKPTLDPNNHHVGDWLNRVYEAIRAFGF